MPPSGASGAPVTPQTVHANCIALDGRAALITGPSGSGKSCLSLQLMALGANLVADDYTILTRFGPSLIASCPAPLLGLIEARGIGILKAETLPQAEITVVIDLSVIEPLRLPPARTIMTQGCRLPLIYGSEGLGFASAVLQFLKMGRHA